MRLCGLFVILVQLIITVKSVFENAALSSILPYTLQPSIVGSFLSGIISGATVLTPQCHVCNAVAALYTRAPCVRHGNCIEETAKLVNFYCVKAKTKDVFALDLSDRNASTNVMDFFDPSFPFAFLIHGFTDYYPGVLPIRGTAWMKPTIMDWAGEGVNVCAVNWGPLSRENVNYFVASQVNTGRVADYLVEVLLRFEASGMKISETSLAGHSLGGQIAGKTGHGLKILNKKLGTIYGLDPAGPCFTIPCTVAEELRLDASDANHVQCIHTNIGGLGQIQRCGCQDFYLNLAFTQPGYIDTIRAHFFVDIIFHWTLQKENKCRSKGGGQLMGIHSDKTKCGLYQLFTSAKEPYC